MCRLRTNHTSDLICYGSLVLSGTEDIYVYDDVFWKAGATASAVSNNNIFQIAGDMTFEPGSNINLTYGLFYFYANGNSTVYVYEDAHICVLASFKSSPYSLGVDGFGTKTLYIGMGFRGDSGYILKMVGPVRVNISGDMIVNGTLECTDGTIVFEGNADCDLTCSSANGSYFNNLTVRLQNSHSLFLTCHGERKHAD